MTPRLLAALLGCAWLSVAPASGQTRDPRFEVSGAVMFAGGHDLVDVTANILPNQQGGGEYRLFESETRLEAAPAFEGRVGWRLTPRFAIDGGVFMSRPELATRLSEDVESAPGITATEDLSLYIFDAGVIFSFGTPGSRVAPFVRGGAGYVRQLHEDNVLVETGQAYHAGGGVTAWFGQRRRAGARIDARIYFLQGGIDLGASSRTMTTLGGAIVFAF